MTRRLAMVRVADRDGQRVGGIGARDLDAWKLKPDHMVDLAFVGVTHPDHGLLDRVWKIFANGQPCLRGHKKGDPARLPQLQSGHRILVDEGLLDGCGVRPIG